MTYFSKLRISLNSRSNKRHRNKRKQKRIRITKSLQSSFQSSENQRHQRTSILKVSTKPKRCRQKTKKSRPQKRQTDLQVSYTQRLSQILTIVSLQVTLRSQASYRLSRGKRRIELRLFNTNYI